MEIREKALVKLPIHWLFLYSLVHGIFFALEYTFHSPLQTKGIMLTCFSFLFIFILIMRLFVDVCFFRFTYYISKTEADARMILKQCLETMKISSFLLLLLGMAQIIFIKEANNTYQFIVLYIVQIFYCAILWMKFQVERDKKSIFLTLFGVYLLLSVGANLLIQFYN